MFTRTFWRKTAERAAKSAGQSALLAVGADKVNALDADWATIAGFALGGAVLSILTSLASLRVGPADDPSVTE